MVLLKNSLALKHFNYCIYDLYVHILYLYCTCFTRHTCTSQVQEIDDFFSERPSHAVLQLMKALSGSNSLTSWSKCTTWLSSCNHSRTYLYPNVVMNIYFIRPMQRLTGRTQNSAPSRLQTMSGSLSSTQKCSLPEPSDFPVTTCRLCVQV